MNFCLAIMRSKQNYCQVDDKCDRQVRTNPHRAANIRDHPASPHLHHPHLQQPHHHGLNQVTRLKMFVKFQCFICNPFNLMVSWVKDSTTWHI